MKIDVNTIKAFCEGASNAGVKDVLDMYSVPMREHMRYWEMGYEAAMNAVINILAKYEDADN